MFSVPGHALVMLHRQQALRDEMAKLLDPSYERHNLQEAFMTTWGRMADVEEDNIMFMGCPVTIWSRPTPARHSNSLTERENDTLLPLLVWPRTFLHAMERTARLQRQLHRLWVIVTREWRFWCWRQVACNIWKQDFAESHLANILAAGLEDTQDLQEALQYMENVSSIDSAIDVMENVARVMGIPLPAFRIHPCRKAIWMIDNGFSVSQLKDPEYLPKFSRNCVLLAGNEGLITEVKTDPEVQWH